MFFKDMVGRESVRPFYTFSEHVLLLILAAKRTFMPISENEANYCCKENTFQRDDALG